jgi:hypothetical protein
MEVRMCSLADLECEMVLQEDVRTAVGMLLVAKGTQINYALLVRLRNFLRRSTISETALVHVPHWSSRSRPQRFCSPFNQAFVIRALERWVVALVVGC